MNLALTMAMSGYEHVRDLAVGTVRVEGVDLTTLTLPVEEIFYRFLHYREWQISELSLARYVALRAAGDESVCAIPVFPSQVCRHSSIFTRYAYEQGVAARNLEPEELFVPGVPGHYLASRP